MHTQLNGALHSSLLFIVTYSECEWEGRLPLSRGPHERVLWEADHEHQVRMQGMSGVDCA